MTDKGFSVPHGYEITHLVNTPDAAGKTLVIYGQVIYRDTITPNQEHETQWCFGYIPDAGSPILGGDFISTGPEEYTGHIDTPESKKELRGQKLGVYLRRREKVETLLTEK